MSDSSVRDAQRARPDAVLSDMAAYALTGGPFSDEARETARLCLMDSLGCALAALEFPACTRLLGPVVPGAVMPGGARVPGTAYELDPVQAAFNIGAMIRWLDFNDTFLAAEWGTLRTTWEPSWRWRTTSTGARETTAAAPSPWPTC